MKAAHAPPEPVVRPPGTGTWIDIDSNALGNNLRGLRRHMGDATLCMVVKGNAYGHGYNTIVPLAEVEGVRRFAVFSAREAAGFLAASDGKSTLMVMGHGNRHNLPWMMARGIEPWLNDDTDWPMVADVLEDHPAAEIAVHLELETGMNRTGLSSDAALDAAVAIADHPRARLAGVCTHLAGAEDSRNDTRVNAQRERYFAFLDALAERGIDPGIRHIASSSAALLDPSARLDMVRVGIACYGLWPSPEVRQRLERHGALPRLANVLSWHARVVALKDVRDGEFVGYGTSYEAEGDQKVAVVAVGYADGFTRELSNRGHVLIRGRRASIIGNVNMNMAECHVTHIPDVQVGDEVTLIGRQQDCEISVASFSDFNQVVNYELMSRLSWEIPRRVVAGPSLTLGDLERDS